MTRGATLRAAAAATERRERDESLFTRILGSFPCSCGRIVRLESASEERLAVFLPCPCRRPLGRLERFAWSGFGTSRVVLRPCTPTRPLSAAVRGDDDRQRAQPLAIHGDCLSRTLIDRNGG